MSYKLVNVFVFLALVFVSIHLFTNHGDWNSKKPLSLTDKFYITTSNVSTVGYGDFLPVTKRSRYLVSWIHFIILIQLTMILGGVSRENVLSVLPKRVLKIVMIQTFFSFVFVYLTKNNEWVFPLNSDTNNYETMLYFTQTTFTTCGYGDIYPTTQKTKIMTMLMHFIIMLELI
jgi:hypothetical protein